MITATDMGKEKKNRGEKQESETTMLEKKRIYQLKKKLVIGEHRKKEKKGWVKRTRARTAPMGGKKN